MIDNLVGEIGQKLSVRTAPEKGYIRRTTIRVPMDLEDFDGQSFRTAPYFIMHTVFC